MFLALLKDDFPEVRLNNISKLEQVRLGQMSLGSPPRLPFPFPSFPRHSHTNSSPLLGQAVTSERLIFQALLQFEVLKHLPEYHRQAGSGEAGLVWLDQSLTE